jgi:hypothetical protein
MKVETARAESARYLDIQAYLGITKHNDGLAATRELMRFLPQVHLPQLISHRFALVKANEAFQAARTAESMKVVLTMPSGT